MGAAACRLTFIKQAVKQANNRLIWLHYDGHAGSQPRPQRPTTPTRAEGGAGDSEGGWGGMGGDGGQVGGTAWFLTGVCCPSMAVTMSVFFCGRECRVTFLQSPQTHSPGHNKEM